MSQGFARDRLLVPYYRLFLHNPLGHRSSASGGGSGADPFSIYFKLAGRVGGQTGIGGTASGNDLVFRSNTSDDGRIILGNSIAGTDSVVIHGTQTGVTIGGITFETRAVVHGQSSGAEYIAFRKHFSGATQSAKFLGARSRGTAGAPTALLDNDQILTIVAAGYDGTDFELAAQIAAEVDDTAPSGTSMGGRIALSTTRRTTTALVEHLSIDHEGGIDFLNSTSPASGQTKTHIRYAPTLTIPATLATIRSIDLSPTVTTSDNFATMRYIRIGGTHVQTTIAPSNFMILAAFANELTSTSNANGIFPWSADLIADSGIYRYDGNGTAGAFAATTPGNYLAVSLLLNPTLSANLGASWTFSAGGGMALISAGGSLQAVGATGSTLTIPLRTIIRDTGPGVTTNNGGTVNLNLSTTIATLNYTRAATGIISCVYSELAAAANKWFLYGAGTAASSHVGAMRIGGVAGVAPTAQLDVNQGTINKEVTRFESATSGTPAVVSEVRRQGRVTTTDATVTTLMSYTLTAARAYLIEARVVAHRTGGAAGAADDSAAYIVWGGFKHTGGAAAIITAVVTIFADEDQAAWDATMDVSASTVRVRVTGATDNNVTWHCTLVIQEVGS